MKNKLSNLVLIAFVFVLASCNSNNRQVEGEEPQVAVEELPQNEPLGTTNDPTFETSIVKGDIASPRKEMKGVIDDVEVTVNYGSPSVKGRTIWGELVPFNQVWRTGANEATTFEVNKDIQVADKKLKAGRYGLFTIPKKDGWTIIFNSVADQWGHYEYDKAKDALRVEVKSKSAPDTTETMEFIVENKSVVLRWKDLAVPFSIAGT